jgi:hypothetical protein
MLSCGEKWEIFPPLCWRRYRRLGGGCGLVLGIGTTAETASASRGVRDVLLVFDNALLALGNNLGHEIQSLTTT